MDQRRELRKFPKGERCPECGSRRWYLESGLRFCSNGHQVEGFVQFDVGDEEDAGKLGATVRREKETKERELRQLTGQAGKNLYLECLQLILRSQLLWLTNEKGHREELETVVRDLWDLRTRGSSTLVPEEDAAAGGELEMFSSQPAPEEATRKPSGNEARAQDWNPDRGSNWPMPRVIDTLVFCYLGCLLLRIPTRIGEIFYWANEGHIPYKRAYYNLPQEMQDRLPSAYTRALKYPLRNSLRGIDLHDAVFDTALSFNLNYDLSFPEISDSLVLFQYTKRLALPVEILITARRIMAAMHIPLLLPIRKSRVFILDHPEILLTAVTIVATKLCFPFHTSQAVLQEGNTTQGSTFRWKRWRKYMRGYPGIHQMSDNEPKFDQITVDKVTQMTAGELDAYFAHVSSLIDKRNENSIVGFFPSESAPDVEPSPTEITEDQVDNKLSEVLAGAIQVGEVKVEDSDSDVESDEDLPSDSTSYEAFRAVEDLTKTAKQFYEAAGSLAGLSLQETVRAVYMLEQRILAWQWDGTTGEDVDNDVEQEEIHDNLA